MSNLTPKALSNVLSSAERASWDLFQEPITDEAQRQRVLGKLEGIGMVLQFIDTELSIIQMEEAV